MEFMTILPRIVRQHDSLMVVVDTLTKVALILEKFTFSASDEA